MNEIINPAQAEQKLVWMDLEMTGLNPDKDLILEIATIITGPDLEIIAHGPQLVINQSEDVLKGMNEWNTNHHTKSGLIDKVMASTVTTEQAEQKTLAFIQQYVPEGTGILAGNSIWQDRRFIIKHMAKIDQYLHYRMLDVSSVKILAKLWYETKSFSKEGTHRALADIEESIKELKYYQSKIFRKGSPGDTRPS